MRVCALASSYLRKHATLQRDDARKRSKLLCLNVNCILPSIRSSVIKLKSHVKSRAIRTQRMYLDHFCSSQIDYPCLALPLEHATVEITRKRNGPALIAA